MKNISTSSEELLAERERRNKRLLKILGIVILGMVGFTAALVPMYNVLCAQLGINGKVDVSNGPDALGGSADVDESRTITVQFLGARNAEIPWDFKPLQTTVEVHPGENKLIAYYAKNDTDHAMTIQAIPSITPSVAAKYLHKTECFCFTRQTLGGGEEREMPMLFHLDPELPKYVTTVTLAYTLFDTSKIKHPLKRPTKEGRIG